MNPHRHEKNRNWVASCEATLSHKSQNGGENCYHTLQVVVWHRRVLLASLWRVRMWQTRQWEKRKKNPRGDPPTPAAVGERWGQRWESGCPPWKLGATDSPHQQLIHWGSEEFLVRDYSRASKEAIQGCEKEQRRLWMETNRIPKGGSANRNTWRRLFLTDTTVLHQWGYRLLS